MPERRRWRRLVVFITNFINIALEFALLILKKYMSTVLVYIFGWRYLFAIKSF